MALPESTHDLLASDAIGHVITLDADGSPHVSVAWLGVEDGEVVIGTLSDQRKLRNIRRDPRVALSVQGEKIHPPGLKEYLVLYGRARITEGGAPELLQELAHTYLGPDVKFPPFDNPPPGYVTRIAVERIAGVGPWAR